MPKYTIPVAVIWSALFFIWLYVAEGNVIQSHENQITCSQITNNIPDVCSHYNDSTSE